MLVANVPVKTELGQQELRRRTGGLGQRHRTFLFLVDGRRPLSEVLVLAHKAGAATTHFEDLVRLGFVELPPEEASASPAPVVEAMPEADPQPVLTHVELTVTADSAEALAAAPEPPVPTPESVPPPQPPTSKTPARVPHAPHALLAPVAPVVPPLVPRRPVAPVHGLFAAPAPPAKPSPPLPVAARRVRAALARTAPAVKRVPAPAPADPLADVRECLLKTLRLDPTPFATRARPRIRNAKTAGQLIELIWELERDRSHARRSREGLWSLQTARELLGLGNTLVEEERPSEMLE